MAKNNLKTINYNTVDKSNDKDVGFTASKSNDIKIQQKKFETYLANSYNYKQLWFEKCNKYNINEPSFILPKVPRIIVIGDVHGDWDRTLKVLKIAKVIDQSNNWIGGNTVVVQLGDQIDRCRFSNIPCYIQGATEYDEGNDLKLLKYFTQLHKQAQKHGGAVYSLLGNHEVMNVQQNLRYVSYEGLKEFDNFMSGKRIIKDGKTARLWRFKPGNDISEFLACTRQVAIIIGSNLFVHAGILPQIAEKYNVTSINMIMTLYLWNKLKDITKYSDIIHPHNDSPLWTRVFGNLGNLNLLHNNNPIIDKIICKKIITPLETIYNIGKIYVGHTTTLSHKVNNICHKKIWLTDYGLSKGFDKFFPSTDKKKLQVLEIIDDGREFNILEGY